MARTTYTPEPQSEDAAALGRRFRAVREGKGLALHELATLMDRTINFIRWHEAGARLLRLDDLIVAADKLGVPVADLTVPLEK